VGVDVESHPWFGGGGVKTLVCREGWELASPDRGSWRATIIGGEVN